MDGDDVGMVQRGSGLCLLHKALHPIRMSSNISGQNLQRNSAIKFRILRQIHFSHSTFTDFRADFVAAEFCAGGNGHVVWRKLLACGFRVTAFTAN